MARQGPGKARTRRVVRKDGVDMQAVVDDLDEAVGDLDSMIDEADQVVQVGLEVDAPGVDEVAREARGWIGAVLGLVGLIGVIMLLDWGCRAVASSSPVAWVGRKLFFWVEPLVDTLLIPVEALDRLGTRLGADRWVGYGLAAVLLIAVIWFLLFVMRTAIRGLRRGGAPSLGASVQVRVEVSGDDPDKET